MQQRTRLSSLFQIIFLLYSFWISKIGFSRFGNETIFCVTRAKSVRQDVIV